MGDAPSAPVRSGRGIGGVESWRGRPFLVVEFLAGGTDALHGVRRRQ